MNIDKLQEIELGALRNEMREWQARRFVLITVSVPLVGVILAALQKQPPLSDRDGFLVSILGGCSLVLLAALAAYCKSANARGAAYIRVAYPEYQWERWLESERTLPVGERAFTTCSAWSFSPS